MKTAKYKTAWDLTLFYKSLNDPQIEKDVVEAEKAYELFAKKYSKKQDYLKGGNPLLKILNDWEKLQETKFDLVFRYLHFIVDLDASNSKAQALNNVITARATAASNKVIFFELSLSKISKNMQKLIMADKRLSKYYYYLSLIFKTAQYNLSEKEEKILSLKSQPAHRMWVDAQGKFISSQNITFKGREMSLAEAIDLRITLGTKDRHALHKILIDRCKEISFYSEAELSAIVTNKKTSDDLRGFKSPEEATILSYQNEKKSVDNLVATTTKYFSVSHRFYKLKAKLMGVKQMSVADISASVGKSLKKTNLDEAVTLIRESFTKADPEFREMFDRMLEKGQIDIYPKKGKKGGAYCSWSHNGPTVVLMNYVDSPRSVETLAHEMGHAIHGELSKGQPILYEDCTTSVAEVASTFFENILFDHVFPSLPEKEKFFALFSHVQDDISTVFRQIAFFNFEKEMHATVSLKGAMSADELAKTYAKHLKSYLGPAVGFQPNDGYGYVYVPHFRSFFYVYSYAYGQLISKAMYGNFKKDPSFMTNVRKFLSAGSSMSPEDIFKSIGIDTSKPAFFEDGLKSIEQDIIELEKLAKKAGMVK